MTVTSMASLTRITDLNQNNFDVRKIEKSNWASGDYVVGELTDEAHRV